MFTGIDEVDWASLRHAYGSAEDVPALLRALASADRAEREVALDGMYGSVHHQGNVYDSTFACVPFLFGCVQESLLAQVSLPWGGTAPSHGHLPCPAFAALHFDHGGRSARRSPG